ncbi:MAG: hypothetical protein M0D53_04120 [Flavobacterium sp. JAD_PAG50586_2]|nr:MAG: hypothetical protein M0D53_04120 [Flavobacterium sp. JAD_PAG50586_2]
MRFFNLEAEKTVKPKATNVMNYKDHLLELILDDDDNAMMNWILLQPLLDQPQILRELKELLEELDSTGSKEVSTLLMRLDKGIDEYEERILDEKLAEAQYLMALEQQEKTMKEIDAATDGIRAYVIECIVTNAPNAKEMKELAGKIIELEKETGTFDPENWKEIL